MKKTFSNKNSLGDVFHEKYYLNGKLLSKMVNFIIFYQETIRPYYTGWIMENGSRWEKDINMHIMQCNQVKFSLVMFEIV